jgi:hypothetical protein
MKALRDKVDLFGLFHPNHAGLICREFMGPPLSMRNPKTLEEKVSLAVIFLLEHGKGGEAQRSSQLGWRAGAEIRA